MREHLLQVLVACSQGKLWHFINKYDIYESEECAWYVGIVFSKIFDNFQ